MSEIKAIEKLRRLLDERGIEWTYADGTVSFANNERWFHAWAYNDGAMCVSMGYLTPEQAIAATLGSEREKELESLVKQLWHLVNHRSGYGYAAALEAIEELGIEVDSCDHS